MKFSVLFFFISISVWGQNESETDSSENGCIKINRYNSKQKRNFYPFSKAFYIELVSYDFRPYSEGINNEIANNNHLTIKIGINNDRFFDEIKTLTSLDIDHLTEIIYNNTFKPSMKYEFEISSDCYNPRNAILFLDKNKNVFAYIKLCFECQRYELSSKKINAGKFCYEKYDLLKEFFKESGIKIGISSE